MVRVPGLRHATGGDGCSLGRRGPGVRHPPPRRGRRRCRRAWPSLTLCHRSLPSPTLCRHTLPPLFAATLCQGTLQPTLPSTVVHRGSLCTRCRAGRLTRLKAARMPRRRLLQHGERGPAAPLPRARAAGLLGAAQGHAQRAADDRARGHRGRRALTLPHALVLSEQRSSVSVSHSVLSLYEGLYGEIREDPIYNETEENLPSAPPRRADSPDDRPPCESASPPPPSSHALNSHRIHHDSRQMDHNSNCLCFTHHPHQNNLLRFTPNSLQPCLPVCLALRQSWSASTGCWAPAGTAALAARSPQGSASMLPLVCFIP